MREASERLEFIPLGGGAEVGKNMLVFRYGDDMIVVDCGVQFPTEEHPGVDLILPDFQYLRDNAAHLRAIILTHAHEDHVGGLPYVLKEVDAPVYGAPLTIGMVRAKLEEHKLADRVSLRVFRPGERLSFGAIEVEPVHVTHSIPDTVSLAIRTPVGLVVHTGDFKIDQTPSDGKLFDAGRFAQLGDEGVLLLISDTVNAEKTGWVPSERMVARALEQQIVAAPGRVLVTAFASNLHRVQEVFAIAERHGRRVAVAGRSMARNIEVARELGYIQYPDPLRVKVEDIESLPPDQVVILTTGSQGEPLSALSRMACDNHKIHVEPGDTVILSSRPIPGNEDAVWRTVNRLIRLGARVVYDLIVPIHVSGHANQEELKLLYNLTRPLYVVPFHGEPRMMAAYTDMLTSMGHPRDRVLWMENGDRLALDGTTAELLEPIEASGDVLVDGISEGGVSEFVIRDRRHLASDGTVIVTVALDRATGEVLDGPELISRGFLHPEDSEELFAEAQTQVRAALEGMGQEEEADWDNVRATVRDVVSRFLRKRTSRRPVVVPVVMNV